MRSTMPITMLAGALASALPAGARAADGLSGDLVEFVGTDAATDRATILPIADGPASLSVTMPGARAMTATATAATPPAAAAPTAAAGDTLVARVARRYRIDPPLLAAIVRTESGGRRGAVSPKGALGLMQVMPATARGLGVADPRRLLADEGLALATGAAYLKALQARLGDDVRLVVAAYNAGPGAVLKVGRRVPAFPETQAYVGRVMAAYAAARAAAGLR